MTEVEEDHSQEECGTCMAESAARRADKVNEVEEMKDTRSPPRHQSAWTAR